MEQLEKLKSEIAHEEKLLADAVETVNRLTLKREEITGRIAEIDGTLSVAEENQNAAVTRFARGEISEDKLDKFQAPISTLVSKKNTITRSLDVVEADLSEAVEARDGIRETLDTLKRRAWTLIANAELSKAAVLMRRAFVARGKSQDADMNYDSRWRKNEFLESEEVNSAVFHSESESYELASDLLAREYL